MVFEWGVVCGSGRGAFVTGGIGQFWGAHWVYVVWREKRHVMAGRESGRSGTEFGVEWEFMGGPGAVECVVCLQSGVRVERVGEHIWSVGGDWSIVWGTCGLEGKWTCNGWGGSRLKVESRSRWAPPRWMFLVPHSIFNNGGWETQGLIAGLLLLEQSFHEGGLAASGALAACVLVQNGRRRALHKRSSLGYVWQEGNARCARPGP